MPKVIIGLLIGLVVGGVATFLLFVGAPRAAQVPGAPIKGPDASLPPGQAQIVLRQDFFNEVLTTIFRDMNKPAFPLGLASLGQEPDNYTIQNAAFQTSQCDGKITVLPEGSGVKTGVRFENNHISAPLAFAGNYDSPFGCVQFTGWAQATLELRFDSAQQVLFGRINVDTVNLDGVNPIISGFVTPIVQTSLNNRVNPIQILDGKQIALDVPMASTGGKLQAKVTDMRADFRDDALNLYVVYGFTGTNAP